MTFDVSDVVQAIAAVALVVGLVAFQVVYLVGVTREAWKWIRRSL
jgi:hypothetical protein